MLVREIREEILEAGRRLYTKRFVASNDGNISARLDGERVLVTATKICKGDMTQDDILVVDYDGNLIEGSKVPTSEIKMHLAVYKARPDVMAIVHAHPPNATAFAVAGLNLDKLTMPEAIFTLGNISFAEYGTPSTSQIPDEVRKVIHNSDAVLLANHGALCAGESVMDAYFKMETLDHFAAITLKARALGGERELDPSEESELFRIRSEVFGKKGINCDDCGMCEDGKDVKDSIPACIKKENETTMGRDVDAHIREAVSKALENLK